METCHPVPTPETAWHLRTSVPKCPRDNQTLKSPYTCHAHPLHILQAITQQCSKYWSEISQDITSSYSHAAKIPHLTDLSTVKLQSQYNDDCVNIDLSWIESNLLEQSTTRPFSLLTHYIEVAHLSFTLSNAVTWISIILSKHIQTHPCGLALADGLVD